MHHNPTEIFLHRNFVFLENVDWSNANLKLQEGNHYTARASIIILTLNWRLSSQNRKEVQQQIACANNRDKASSTN